MWIVTAETMRALDKRAIEEFGIPGVVLMENAGRAVVEVLRQEIGPLRNRRIAVFCGTGNNGGDGFVIARLLRLEAANVECFLMGDAETLTGDARIHFAVAKRLCVVHTLTGCDLQEPLSRLNAEIAVDALLGTGLRAAPRPRIAEAIRLLNSLECPVVAVDIPSGVNADTGERPGEAVRATHTITFAYPKLGLYLFPGAECVGRLHVADIGFDWQALEVETPYRLAGGTIKKRAPESNKGDYGQIGIIAGSRGMAGAPALAARAAQRVGAGLVTVLAAACVQPTIAAKLDEQMTVPLPDTDGAVNEMAFETIARFAARADVFCIGPGLTTAPGTVALMLRLLTEIVKPIVLDADGLNALAQRPDVLTARPNDPSAPLILTPHPGEAARLLGTSIPEIQSDRIQAVCELARRYRAIAVLKGRHTLIADPEGQVVLNTSGNAGMATGGAGDTLTGILGGLLGEQFAQKRELIPSQVRDTVALGVHLHGLAGDLAAAQQGEAGLVAGDLITHLPAALRLLEVEN